MYSYSQLYEIAKKLRVEYPEGNRVELVKMNDPYRQMPKGLCGTVVGVDDMASIMVHWDNGSSLSVAYGEDKVKKLK